MNGKKVFDGDAVPTQFQPTPLDQQSCATEGLDNEKADDESPSSAIELSSPDLIDEAVASWIDEPPLVKDTEGEGRSDHQQEHVEDPRQKKGNMSSIENNKDSGYISSAGSINTEQELGLLLKYTQMEGGTRGESTVTVQKAITSLVEKMEEQVHFPRVVKPTLADARDDETVCWDEQIVVPDAEETPVAERSEQVLISPQFDTQGQRNDVQVNWHFSAGPGLIEEVRCPLWHLPPMSYYPVLEPRGPFEGADKNVAPVEICECLTSVNTISCVLFLPSRVEDLGGEGGMCACSRGHFTLSAICRGLRGFHCDVLQHPGR